MNKLRIALVLVIIAVIGALWWLYTHSYVEIIVKNPNTTPIHYSMVNQSNGKETTVKSSKNTVKKLLARGNYEITVQQGDQSYFSVVKTGPFLGTTKIEATVQKERSRTFVGNSPGYCMYYDQSNSVLYSHNCSGSYTDLKIHKPATFDEATYTLSPATPDRPLRGIIELAGKPYVLLGDKDTWPPNNLIPLQSDFTTMGGTLLKNLRDDKSYYVKEYQKGFIAYSDDYNTFKYYESPTADPKNITIPEPKNQTLSGAYLDVQQEKISVLYTDTEVGDEGLEPDETQNENVEVKGESVVVVYSSNATKSLTFNKIYSRVLFCGKNKLCLLTDKTLDVYDISKNKQKYLFTIDNVENFIHTDMGTILVRQNEVLLMDIEKRRGYKQYSFGGYVASCGLQKTGNNYILCVVDDDNHTSALYIDQGTEDMDSIDKKILELYEVPDVENISIYRSIIYTSPVTGAPEYKPETRTYGYNQVILNESKNQIDKAINRIGIDRNKYQIISTY